MLPVLFAQTVLTGVVCEKGRKDPVPYVYIYVENYEQEGVLSDANGKFSLKLKNDAENVIFTHIAFKDKIVPVKAVNPEKSSTIYMQENIRELEEVVVKGMKSKDSNKIIKEMLRKFNKSFANYLSLSKSYLLNLGYYDKTCISYIESVGFLYTPPKKRMDEMLFLPYNSKVSDVCYDKVEELKQISMVEKTYSFASFKRDLIFFHKKSPIKKWKHYKFSILSVDKDKMNVSFQTKKNNSFKCEGTMTFDLKNNIIRDISITSLLSPNAVKVIKRGKTPYQQSTLKIGFKHFNNKAFYKSFEHKVHYNYVKTNKLNNYLYISLLFDYPSLLEAPIYKNPIGYQFASSCAIYENSLVRIYYNENFWKHNSFMPEHTELAEIEKDLGGKNNLINQFRKNNLAYVPTTDKLRYKQMDSLFSNGIYHHKMKVEGKKATKIYDYILMYRITDSIVRPMIENMNHQKEISWKK